MIKSFPMAPRNGTTSPSWSGLRRGIRDNKLEKPNDAVVSGHQFFRNDTGAASRSDVRSPVCGVRARGGGGDDPGPTPGLPAPFRVPLFIKLPFA